MFGWVKNLFRQWAREAVDAEVIRVIEEMKLAHEHQWEDEKYFQKGTVFGNANSLIIVQRCIICGELRNHVIS